MSMAAQSDRLVGALGRVVSGIDDMDTVLPIVERLGRDHRKFAVRAEHYPMVGEALLATLAHFLGDEWSPELESDWAEAFTIVADTIMAAAAAAELTSPPWWDAEIIAHERRGFDVALLRIRPQPALPFRAGQSIAVESSSRPKVWRPYSPANAPRADGTIDLHVKAVPGGQLSNALVNGVGPGDVLRLGPPVGNRLTLDGDVGRDLLLLAGGTGLAPLKAIVEELSTADRSRQVTLFVGARTGPDLYDLPALRLMERQLHWLSVVPVVSHDPYFDGVRGSAADAALRQQHWSDREVYVCGPDGMVDEALPRLVAAGVPIDRIHTEDLDVYQPQAQPGASATVTMEVPAL